MPDAVLQSKCQSITNNKLPPNAKYLDVVMHFLIVSKKITPSPAKNIIESKLVQINGFRIPSVYPNDNIIVHKGAVDPADGEPGIYSHAPEAAKFRA